MTRRVVVIGAGASGMVAALVARQAGATVTLLERGERPGRKLLATGNGRCNILNIHAPTGHYHGGGALFAERLLEKVSPDIVVQFFQKMGLVVAVEEDGRVYPASAQASTVLDTLRFQMERHGVQPVCSVNVSTIERVGEGFRVAGYTADAVIVACGGAAAPQVGGSTGGYALLSALGHRMVPLCPALSPLTVPPESIRSLKGMRTSARLRLFCHGQFVQETTGEVLFSDDTLSGIAAMELARFVAPGAVVRLHLLPDDALLGMENRLLLYTGMPWERFFTGWLPRLLARFVLKQAGLSPEWICDAQGVPRLLQCLTDGIPLPIRSVKSWDRAQITAGGIALSDFTEDLQSKIVPNLYACGEVLDVDADCGGFNLLWAWASGMRAGRAASGGSKKDE